MEETCNLPVRACTDSLCDACVAGAGPGGEITCRRRFVETHQYRTGEAMLPARPRPREQAGDGADDRERSGTANTAMVFHAGRLLCLEEASQPWQVRGAEGFPHSVANHGRVRSYVVCVCVCV